MNNTNIILVLVVLTNLKLLGSSRLGASIRVVAMQGVVLGLLPVLAHMNELSVRFAVLAAGTIALKGIVFPWFLFRAVREAEVTREIEPYVGYVTSLLAGVLILAVSFWMCERLPMPETLASSWLAPVAFFSIFAGLFLIVSRKRAVSQVLGFSRAGERRLRFWRGFGAAYLVAGRSGGAARRVRGGVRHGHHHLPHQS